MSKCTSKHSYRKLKILGFRFPVKNVNLRVNNPQNDISNSTKKSKYWKILQKNLNIGKFYKKILENFVPDLK